MPLVKPDIESFASIKVVGVGGSGGNAVEHMISKGIRGVEFIAINTDAQDLHNTKANTKLHIGKNVTKGLGAGMDPELGRLAAEENKEDIEKILEGADMVFLTCGLGGGTGSGAGPIVAEIAKSMGALTVAVVTKPFSFEGSQRAQIAKEALDELQGKVDTLITIQNDRLLSIIEKKTTLREAFGIVDDVLRQAVQGISDLITYPGIINVDFADVRAIMQDAGSALMGIGMASGEDRAVKAALSAIQSPLLEISIEGARGVLFNVSGNEDLTMAEVAQAAKQITDSIDPDAKVIFGVTHDDSINKGEIKITVIATGFDYQGQAPLKTGKIKEVREIYKSTERPKTFQTKPLPSEKTAVFSPKRELPKIHLESSEDITQINFDQSLNIDSDAKERNQPSEQENNLDIPAFIRKKLK